AGVRTLREEGHIEHGILARPGRAATMLYWRLRGGPGGTLAVRPLLSGRDYHALHHENPALRFDAEVNGARARRLPPLSRPSGARRLLERHLHPPAGLVPELPLHRGARSGTRPRRGS